MAASRLSSDTAAYERSCVERISQLSELSKDCTDLSLLCDKEKITLSKLLDDIRTETISKSILHISVS